MRRIAGIGMAACLVWMGIPVAAGGAETLAEVAFKKLREHPPVCGRSFDFAVIGDSRALEPLVQPEEFQQMIREWNLLRPSFVFDIGDLILGGAAEGVGPQWDLFESVARRCEPPFFPIVGNHDVSDAATESIYTERIGPLTYAFSYGNTRFVALNSEEQGAVDRLSDAQVSWLKEDLRENPAEHIFLFLHQPYFASDWDKSWSNVAEAIKGYPVRAVFAGHEHMHRYWGERDGVQYVITGGGGSEISTPESEGGFFHYLWVHVEGDKVHWSIIRPGNVLPFDVVPESQVEELRRWEAAYAIAPVEAPYGQSLDQTFVMNIQNPGTEAFSGTISWQIPAGWHVEPASSAYTLTGNGAAALPFRIWADSPSAVRYPAPRFSTPAPVMQFTGQATVSKELPLTPVIPVPHTTGPVTVDGVLEEWDRSTALPLLYSDGFDIANTSDLQSQARWMWDETHLYFAVETEDDEYCQPYAGDIVWLADNIELFLNHWGWGLSLTAKGEEVFLYDGPDRESETVNTVVELRVRRDGRRMVYEAAFPASEVMPLALQAGSSFPFSMIMNDLDPSHPERGRHWAEFTPGAGSGKPFPKVKMVLSGP